MEPASRCESPRAFGSEQNLFGSQTFGTYLDQLKAFVRKECSNDDVALANRILDFLPENAQGNCEFYRQMIQDFRERSRKVEEEIDFLHKFSRWLFRSPRLLATMIEQVKKYLPEEGISAEETVAPARFEELLMQTYKKTLEDPNFSRHSIYDDLHDPIGLGNVPYYLCTLGDVRMIRMPNVLREIEPGASHESTADFHIIEEFSRYLETLRGNGKKHLYINLLSKVKHKEGKIMVAKIAELDTDPKFENRLFVVTFDKDSDFYWQRGEYSDIPSAELFKRVFLDFLFDTSDKGAFMWSKKLDKEQWRSTCQEIINRIHQVYFDSESKLDQQMRCDFIEIAYSRLIQKLFDILEISSCNITCKHSTDRGPSTFSLLYLDHRYNHRVKPVVKVTGKTELSMTLEKYKNYTVATSNNDMTVSLNKDHLLVACKPDLKTATFTLQTNSGDIQTFVVQIKRSNAKPVRMSLKKQSKALVGKDVLRVLALTLQQPLLLQNRPAHDYRVNRLLSAARRILR